MQKNSQMFTESTQVPAAKSMQEIIGILVQAGARSIQMDFGENQRVLGLKWLFEVHGRPIPFDLPVRVERVNAVLEKARSHRTQTSRVEQMAKAERIAWRQLYWWVKAQAALIHTGMVEPAELFSPFAVLPTGETLGARLMAVDGQKLLAAPKIED